MAGSSKEGQQGIRTRSRSAKPDVFLVKSLSQDHPPAVGCQSSDSNQSSQCSVRKLLLMWREAGINTISAKQVKVKIEELLTEYKKLRKSMGKQTIAAVTSRSNFQEKLQVCFDILAPDAKDHIEKDKLRTRAAKEVDLSFIKDQISGARKFCFSKVDKTYSARVEKLKIREIESEERMLKEKARVASQSFSNDSLENEGLDCFEMMMLMLLKEALNSCRTI